MDYIHTCLTTLLDNWVPFKNELMVSMYITTNNCINVSGSITLWLYSKAYFLCRRKILSCLQVPNSPCMRRIVTVEEIQAQAPKIKTFFILFLWLSENCGCWLFRAHHSQSLKKNNKKPSKILFTITICKQKTVNKKYL